MTGESALLKLLAWTSPAFPVGAFSYSHGLEWAVEDGTVRSPAALQAWLRDVIAHGAGRSDAILAAHAHRAAATGDAKTLHEVAELAAALAPTAERRLETLAQGMAFLSAVTAAWPAPALQSLMTALAAGEPARTALAYPVALGLAAGAHGIPAGPTLLALVHGFAANLVSAAVRLVPIGQSDGQRVLAALAPLIEVVAKAAATASLDAIGGAAFRADIASARHETQYTRLFRS